MTRIHVSRGGILIQGDVDMKKVVDGSFLEAALKEIGPYKRAP